MFQHGSPTSCLGSLLLLLLPSVSADIGLTGQLFQVLGGSDVNNAKLAWGPVASGSYQVMRGTTSGSYEQIANITGDTYDDYDLAAGTTYYYTIASGDDESSELSLTPFTPSSTSSYNTYDNTQASDLTIKSKIQDANGLYYRYSYVPGDNNDFVITQATSEDGYTFTGSDTVLTSTTVCAPINDTCHLERLSFTQHPTIGSVVMWAHLENTENYNLAQVASAHAPSPGDNFTFDGTYRPLGHDSRDLTFFADDASTNYTAYLLSATDTNTNMNIYQLTQNWTYVESLTATILKNQYREAPAMIKRDGTYYLYTSRAAGWYPSTPNYVYSSSIASGWSDPIVISNIATFATQSGSVNLLDSNSTSTTGMYEMQGDRWSGNWDPSVPPNRQLFLPIAFSPEGGSPASHYHFYSSVQYTDSDDVASDQRAYGVQAGKVLSVGKTVTADPADGSTGAALINDGTEDYPNDYFAPASVPFSVQFDLGDSYSISAVAMTVRMVQGSETYYQYNVTGSEDGETGYTLLADEFNNTDVGFVQSGISDGGSYRYVKISVDRIINTHNGNEADVFAGVHEVSIFGS